MITYSEYDNSNSVFRNSEDEEIAWIREEISEVTMKMLHENIA